MYYGAVYPNVLYHIDVVDTYRSMKGWGTPRSRNAFSVTCCTLKAVLLLEGAFFPQKPQKVFLEASLATSWPGEDLWMPACMFWMNICALFLGQWLSVEFDRASVPSGAGLGQGRLSWWGSRFSPSPSQTTLAFMVVTYCSPKLVCFYKVLIR